MSQREPTAAYVYQPGSLIKGGGYIFGVAGPGAEWLSDARFLTRSDAERVAQRINDSRHGLIRTLGVNDAELG